MLPSVFVEDFGQNSWLVQELYSLFQVDPNLVDENWASFFSNLETPPAANGSAYLNGHAALAGAEQATSSELQAKASALIAAFRAHGHFLAKTNPLNRQIFNMPNPGDVSLEAHGISSSQAENQVWVSGIGAKEKASVNVLLKDLQEIYAGSIGFEYQHIVSAQEREWLRSRIEATRQKHFGYSKEQRIEFLSCMVRASTMETELNRKYPGQFRFSIEGGEVLMPMLEVILSRSAEQNVSEFVFGMAHRGRLNVLVNTLGRPLNLLFAEFEDYSEKLALGTGDVKYHIGYQGKRVIKTSAGNKEIGVRLVPNASHLEFVNPIVEGVARALQDHQYASNKEAVLPLLMHGDAAFIGQGVVTETFNFAEVPGHSTAGTLHIVINNQVGFTTDPSDYRSSPYSTDFAKAIGAPIFHVNGEDVEACAWIAHLACDYRAYFKKDVVIDFICYRRHGHNEADEPAYTQPATYAEIRARESIAKLYAKNLEVEGILNEQETQKLFEDEKANFAQAEQNKVTPLSGDACGVQGKLKGKKKNPTGVKQEALKEIAQSITSYPEGFSPHAKLKQILERRVQAFVEDKGIDWGLGEALAFGSLVNEGIPVRLVGQDVGRGTFNQRHLRLIDANTQEAFIPLNLVAKNNAKFEIYNSVLSEAAILGFEFGYAATSVKTLVLWEGQFGDFVNGAQVIIDQFISASEAKWNQLSGLVLLLPHGWEGRGPEHSSARLERFLQLCAEGNMTVCQPSNAAQHFHMLRRQALSEVKRPLIVMTPKSLLRLPEASSKVQEFTTGQFEELLVSNVQKPKALVFCSGKVFYEISAGLKEKNLSQIELVRFEQLYPFPETSLAPILEKNKNCPVIWVQEEPKNMGAWFFVEKELREKFNINAAYVGRPERASPATGSSKKNSQEQRQIVLDLIAGIEAIK